MDELKTLLPVLAFAIGLPIAFNTALTGLVMLYINHRLQDTVAVIKADLQRVEEVLDARLTHLEERGR